MPIVSQNRARLQSVYHAALTLGCLSWAVGMAAFAPAALAVNDGEKFQDWTARCEKPDPAQPQKCFVFQLIKDQKGERPMLQVAVGYLPNNSQPAAIYTVPLGVALPKGISIKVDGQEVGRIPYETCLQGGCIAGLLLNEERLETFRRGTKSQITFSDAGGKTIDLEISLKGFTAGFNALR